MRFGTNFVLLAIIILLRFRMPVCNGQDAARKIRAMEKKGRKADRPSHLLNGRVPIFAVSASLYERQRPEMLECGMDGWILKPINFERLKILLAGALSPEDRRSELYRSALRSDSSASHI